jgi:TolB protein
MRIWNLGVLFVMVLMALPVRAQSPAGDGDLRVTQQVRADVRSVRIESPRAEITRLVRAAFGLHGAFEVVSEGGSDFIFSYQPIDATTVEVRIASAGQTLVSRQFSGSDLASAALRASDYAVERTTGLPGFFSGTIACIGQNGAFPQVVLADILFRRTRALTSDRAECLLPEVSPDGRWLLYTTYHRSGFPEIFRIDLRNNRRELFAGYKGVNTGANFSPDGRRVAVILGAGGSDLYLKDATGSGRAERLTRTAGLESDPSWSPDGRRIVYQSDDLGKPQIFVINADGSGRTRIPTNISGNCSEPVWNPRDANLIAFTAAFRGGFQVCLYDASKRESRILTRASGSAQQPTWLPDGRHLIYTESSGRNERLAIIDIVTGKRSYLTTPQMGRFSMADYVAVPLL